MIYMLFIYNPTSGHQHKTFRVQQGQQGVLESTGQAKGVGIRLFQQTQDVSTVGIKRISRVYQRV